MTRDARATIDLGALRHNLAVARKAAGGGRVAAAIKADGYGHGLLRTAGALKDADVFAVACIEEAVPLREAGYRHPILLLEGVFEASELGVASRLGLDLMVHSPWQVDLLETERLAAPVRTWIKVDTGMHRLGFPPDETARVHERLRACASVSQPVCWATHFARADDRGSDYTRHQIGVFNDVCRGHGGLRSLANSAALLAWPESRADLARPGIMLYGASPFVDAGHERPPLRPVMHLQTRLIAINRLERGDPVGYSGTYRCPESMRVGVAAIGYGDGYPRHAENGTPVLVNGRLAPLAGRVSMDMITIDLRAHPDARVGDPVTLWGPGLPAEEVAAHSGTIAYELFCQITRRVRVEEVDGSDTDG